MAKDSGLRKGDRFGRLVVDSWVKEEQGWKCFCDCGSVVFKPAGHLKCGSVLSCGCYRRECDTFNGGTMSYEYSSFIAMHSRAGDKLKEGKLKRQYYDQGVRVCERWNYSLEGFQNFTGVAYRTYHPMYLNRNLNKFGSEIVEFLMNKVDNII